MNLFLPFLFLVSAALAAPSLEPIQTNYHEEVGIPEAARIKAAEEGIDFDGARNVGGSPAILGQFPFMGGLLIALRSGAISVCGSSLLSNTKLVTAAHCWTDGQNTAREFTVVLGSIRLFTGGTRIVTDRIEIHENYDPRTVYNDIGIITIYRVSFTNSIRQISIATGSSTFAGQTAQAVGYGKVRLPPKVGISSFFSANGCLRGLPAGFVRVTSYANWIRPRIL